MRFLLAAVPAGVLGFFATLLLTTLGLDHFLAGAVGGVLTAIAYDLCRNGVNP